MVKLDASLTEVGVLLEPTTIVAKAWEQIERIGARAYFDPKVVAVTGAGPVGLLAALLGVQRGLEVHVYDLVNEGPKPGLVKELGAVFHTDPLQRQPPPLSPGRRSAGTGGPGLARTPDHPPDPARRLRPGLRTTRR